jgi:lipopolysaccharide/colanic/teichoic acid biosynthesis glycosyltransferase
MERDSGLERQNKMFLPGIDVIPGNRSMYYLSKRIVDVIVAILALIIFSPIMLAIAVLIHFDSPGPVIFTQKRVGSIRRKGSRHYYWEKTEFRCFKFRTMVNKADPTIHHDFINALINHDEQKLAAIQGSESKVKKLVNDSRVTRIGHFLRCSSLDELPQFWNVLRGEMSVVGPRPAIPYELESYKSWYFQRLNTKPGITGLWQVGARNSVDFDSMVKLDVEYVKKQSFWLDLKIMILTPMVMFRRNGVA